MDAHAQLASTLTQRQLLTAETLLPLQGSRSSCWEVQGLFATSRGGDTRPRQSRASATWALTRGCDNVSGLLIDGRGLTSTHVPYLSH